MQLLNLLVEGCRDADQNVQLLCVENLGVLGALDPGHLPHKKPGGGSCTLSSLKLKVAIVTLTFPILSRSSPNLLSER